MKRILLNLSSLVVVVAGTLYLHATPASAATEAGTCTAGSGATCSGPNCCANATTCFANCPIQINEN